MVTHLEGGCGFESSCALERRRGDFSVTSVQGGGEEKDGGGNQDPLSAKSGGKGRASDGARVRARSSAQP
jgi:hypothetical protein